MLERRPNSKGSRDFSCGVFIAHDWRKILMRNSLLGFGRSFSAAWLKSEFNKKQEV